ncbi:hypothetical protein [Azoarcus sp. CIB]|uniref:hypothetical protein n=1 Tax=Aromatoleum sp. (strain CIB) TaxID=198107 RepID=UPI00336AC4CC
MAVTATGFLAGGVLVTAACAAPDSISAMIAGAANLASLRLDLFFFVVMMSPAIRNRLEWARSIH